VITRRSGMILIVLTIALSGCFKYVPADIQTVPVGARVRVQLTPAGLEASRTRSLIEGEAISGKLVERRGNSVVFSVRSVRGAEAGTGRGDLVQHVDVLQEHIGRLDLKEIDGTKTALLIGGGTGAIATAALLAMRGDPVSGSGTGPGGADESIRFPFLVFRFYLPH